MSNTALRAELIQFLNDTQRAHHRAYLATRGVDADWPIWYAEFMQARFNAMLGVGCTRSELVYLLVAVEKERAGQTSPAPWAELYADFFLNRYGPNEEQPTP